MQSPKDDVVPIDHLMKPGYVHLFVLAISVGIGLLPTGSGLGGEPYLVKDIHSGSGGSSPGLLTTIGTQLVFRASPDSGGTGLWKTDGTASGTALLRNGIAPQDMIAAGNVAYLVASDGASGYELWMTDASPGGTVMVKDIDPGSGNSFPGFLTRAGTTLYFQAYNGSYGHELWRSNGTDAGTLMVSDIAPGSMGSFPSFLTVVGNNLFFGASDTGNLPNLWKTDGTSGGTSLVKNVVLEGGDFHVTIPVSVGGNLYFEGSNGNGGFELWKSNGTAAGTVRVKDIWAGSQGSFPHALTPFGSILYFVASDLTNSEELWKSDGTSAGTLLVKDIRSGPSGSSPESLTVLGNTLYFSADDGVHGFELWKSDGTEAGTVMVKDIWNGAGGSSPASLVAVGKDLYFQASDGSNGIELWRSDGTPEGTVMVKDLVPGSGDSNPSSMTHAGNRLYFSAMSETSGLELWAMGLFSASLSGVSATTAPGNANIVVSGQVYPFPNVTLSIDYGTSPLLGNTLVVGDFSGTSEQPFQALLYPGGVAGSSTYYYQVRATGEFGTAQSEIFSQATHSSNADLSDISVSQGTLSPVFAGSIHVYSGTVPSATSSVTVTPSPVESAAILETSVNGGVFTTLANGGSMNWPLNTGVNQFQIRVTAPAGNTKLYSMTFTRLTRPTVSNPKVTDITTNSAMLGGQVLSTGGAPITERGVVYSTSAVNSDPVIDGPGVTKMTYAGSQAIFSVPVTDLVHGTPYSFKAYATNSNGTHYSQVLNFLTDTMVFWADGLAEFSRSLSPGARQRYHFTLDEARIVSLASEGGARFRAELRDNGGNVLNSFSNDADFDFLEMLGAGSYVLEVYRANGSDPSQLYTLRIDSKTVPETRPDVAVGATESASVGAKSYLPASQILSLTSRRARPATGYAMISNHGNFPDVQSLRGSGGNEFFLVTYIGTEGNISAALLSGTYQTPEMQSGTAATGIRVLISPNKRRLMRRNGKKTTFLRKSLHLTLTAGSTFDPSVKDAASIRVQTQ